MNDASFFEKLIFWIGRKYRENKAPFLSAFITGILSFGFSFANKLVQQDDLVAMFAKGTSLTGGRWGLEIMSLIFPDVSMPWIYGILATLFVSVAACIVINASGLQNAVLKALFASLLMSSAAVLGIYTQPYLSSSNALAILFSAVSVYYFVSTENWKKLAIGILLLVLSMSIYQAYVSFAAALLVSFLIKYLLVDGKSSNEVFKLAVRYFIYLVISVALYGLLTLCINTIFHVEVLSYASSGYGILKRIRVAYTAFAGYFIKRYFSFVNSSVSLVMHALCAVLSLYAFIKRAKTVGTKETVLSIVLALMLPLAINGFYLAASVDIFSAIVFLGFDSLYLLMFLLIDGEFKNIRGVIGIVSAVIVVCNVYFSNEILFKMYMQTSQMKSFCQGIMDAVAASDEYEFGDEIAIIGDETDFSYAFDRIDSSNYIGLTADDVYNIYTRNEFIKLYLGYNGPFAGFERREFLSCTNEYAAMDCYPDAGGILKIDGTMVVKLG